MIEQKQGHHHKQTNSWPMRGEEETATTAEGGAGSDRQLSRPAWTEQWVKTDVHSNALPHLSSTLKTRLCLEGRYKWTWWCLMNEGLHVAAKPNSRVKTVSNTWTEVQRTPGSYDRSVQRLCCCSQGDVFCVSSCQTCQPWTFCSTISALAKMPICFISSR